MAVKLPLFFAEMLFEQKKKEEALNHVKQMILEQKLQLVLALGAFFCLLYPGSNSLCLLDLLFSNKLSGGLSQQTDILAEPYQLHTERLIVRISISA